MSKFPTIPEFTNKPEDMAAALRAVKQTLEIMAGMRQGESLGAPAVFVQLAEPSAALRSSYKKGDIWVNTGSNAIYYWTGTAWQVTA